MLVIQPFIPAAVAITTGPITVVTDTTLKGGRAVGRADATGTADIITEGITAAAIIRMTRLSSSGFRFRFPTWFPTLTKRLFDTPERNVG